MTKKDSSNQMAEACLLTYLPATYPSPLQVSTPQTPVTGILHTAAINEGTQPVYCDTVLVAVPVGPEANILFVASPPPTAYCNTSKWAITTVEIKSGRELGLDNDLQYASFTFQPRAQNDYLINYNLVFGVQGPMTQIIADCMIKIYENSGTTNNPNDFTLKETSFKVSASTPQFYLQNFATTAPASPTVPATEFANGADIQFSWESNGTFFEIYQKSVAKPIYSGTQTNFKLRGGVATNTSFFLVAMMSGNHGGDQPFGNYQPIFLYDALTITISNPDLTPRSAIISGDAHVGGTFGVTGQTNLGKTIVGGTLTATTEQTNLGNVNVGSKLDVTGQTTLGKTTVDSTLDVTGQTNLKNTGINGTLDVTQLATLNGGLTAVAGAVSMLKGAEKVSPGGYVAKTDGIVVGYIGAPIDPYKFSLAGIRGWTSEGIDVAAQGGNIGAFQPGNDWRKWAINNPQSFTFPVRKGATWNVAVSNYSGNEVNSPASFWWLPLGSATGTTIERIAEAEEFSIQAVSRVPLSKDAYVGELVDVIEEILDRQIAGPLKKRLFSVLLKLQVEEYENVRSDE